VVREGILCYFIIAFKDAFFIFQQLITMREVFFLIVFELTTISGDAGVTIE